MSDPVDPWSPLTRPPEALAVAARRTSATGARELYWALDSEGRCLLLLRHLRSEWQDPRLPRLRGLNVETQPDPGTDRQFLVLRLVESASRELFHRLCLDIIEATAPAATEKEAIDRFLARTWRWHRLLSGGTDDRLSDEEQKGLIGELDVLARQLLPLLGGFGAVEAWTGPFGAPKDFEIGRVCVEVKARRGAAVPQVLISSEHQLDTSGIDGLFLQVVEVTSANAAGAAGRSLTEFVAEVRELVAAHDPAAVLPLEERLAAAGYEALTDYSDRRWIIGDRHTYRIADEFPRITPEMHPAGLGEVRYAIFLPACEDWRVEPEVLVDAVKESCYEFAREFFQEIVTESDADGQFMADVFFERFCDELQAAGDLETADRAFLLGAGSTGIRVDGYGGDPDDNGGLLSLIVADFNQSPEVGRLVATEMDTILQRPLRFLRKALDPAWRNGLEETSPGFGLADLIAQRWARIDRVRILLISNRELSGRVEGRDAEEIDGRPVTHAVWDLRRLHRFVTVSHGREDMEIDLEGEFGGAIPILPAHLQGADYQSYLAVVPGPLLADIYDRWGARLLEQNVRVFL